MLKSFSRCTTLRLAKSPFFHPAHSFSFRDALDKKDYNNDKNKHRIDEKQVMANARTGGTFARRVFEN